MKRAASIHELLMKITSKNWLKRENEIRIFIQPDWFINHDDHLMAIRANLTSLDMAGKWASLAAKPTSQHLICLISLLQFSSEISSPEIKQ